MKKKTINAFFKRKHKIKQYFCQRCGKLCAGQLHHIKAKSYGGLSIESNLTPLCTPCHNDLEHTLMGKVTFPIFLETCPTYVIQQYYHKLITTDPDKRTPKDRDFLDRLSYLSGQLMKSNIGPNEEEFLRQAKFFEPEIEE